MGKKHVPFDQCYERGGSDDCWPWLGLRTKEGYGRYWVPEEKRIIGAHRYAYERKHGRLPRGKQACHSCDNPPCVNPAHVFPGTFLDNMRDKIAKGRHYVPPAPDNRGSRHGMAKLSEDDVREIKRLLIVGLTQMAIAVRYGVSDSRIASINTGKAWRHV